MWNVGKVFSACSAALVYNEEIRQETEPRDLVPELLRNDRNALNGPLEEPQAEHVRVVLNVVEETALGKQNSCMVEWASC